MQPRIRNSFIYIAWTRSKRAELLFWHRSFIHASSRSIVELIVTGSTPFADGCVISRRFLYPFSYIALFLHNRIGFMGKLLYRFFTLNQSMLYFEKCEQILIFRQTNININLLWKKSLSSPRGTNLLTRERNKLAIRVFIEAKKKKKEEEDGGCTLARLTTIGWTKGLDKRVFEFSGRPHRCKGEPG